MFRHNLIIIFRNFKRNKTSFFINLIGLSTGLACALMIYLWVKDELHIDKFNQKDNQLYQVMRNSQGPDGKIITFEWTPGPLAKSLADEMPDVEYAVTVQEKQSNRGTLSYDDKYFKAKELYVSKDFFNVFSYHLIQGGRNKVLIDKYSVVISEELASKIFHTTENIIGKTIEWNQKEISGKFVITGIFTPPPSNSTVKFDLVFTFDLYRAKNPNLDKWTYNEPSTYLLLKRSVDIDLFNRKIVNFLQTKSNEDSHSLFLRRYSDKYLYGKYDNGIQSGGRIEYVRLFSIIALFILVIACINFMNLSTAQASKRIKEIGVKKAMGASRKWLIVQHLGESLLIAYLSLIVAVVLIVILLPQFNAITGKHLNFNYDTKVTLFYLGVTFFTGLMAGIYPALFLSHFNPAIVLKGKFNRSIGELWARKGLVIFQFTISIILIVLVFVVYKQTAYIQSKNLGFDRNNIICFKKEGKLEEGIKPFLSELEKIPGIVNASIYHGDLIVNPTGTDGVNWEGKSPNDKINFKYLWVGDNFIETIGIEVEEGQSFSEEYSTNDTKIIFNETAIKSMGLKDPIGKTITLWGESKQIVGVVKDFNFESLYENLKPCFLLFSSTEDLDNIILKIKTGTERETIERLRKSYQKFNMGLPFDFKFMDDDYQILYESENRVAILSRYFAGIAIIISCLGLFGLTAFTAERRRKEIGIRKVFGSNELDIISLLSIEFSKQLLVSIAIALPISYLISMHWLDSFAYRIKLEWWFFVGAGLIALFIAWTTMGTQAIKAANTNPAQCLKDE